MKHHNSIETNFSNNQNQLTNNNLNNENSNAPNLPNNTNGLNSHHNDPNNQNSVPKKHAKKVFVLGGDGFCGWPTSLYLSSKGYDVVIIDNLSRRAIDEALGTSSLTPISSLETRVETWNVINAHSNPSIKYYILDISKQYHEFLDLIKQHKPDTIIHFAEQRAAPYSMKSSKEKRYTVENNISTTNNLLCAIVDSELEIHIVHLGTMGVYGYSSSGAPIPEGYLKVTLEDGLTKDILHPAYPGSVYHTTKCLDQLLFQFYHQNDGIRITDLHQGIVWGTNTPQTRLHPNLINRFDYDSDYGTVLNRFIMQSALDLPLTIYGTGGQTRAFIHIEDTCKCVEMAVREPPAKSSGRVEILNQVAETLQLRTLAQIISELNNVPISFISNPRKEAAHNDLEVQNDKFKSLGWEPIKFNSRLVEETQEIAAKFKGRVNFAKIAPSSFWNKERELHSHNEAMGI